ncbi:MAG: hypothetical protein JXQ27_14595 [Acidobacteria bacterium]|nr:hypothetical protein [Acidobacteriota bacterium]
MSRIFKLIGLSLILALGSGLAAGSDTAATLQPYLDALQIHGCRPVDFVNNMLTTNHLVIFDDGLHTAREPFEFYQELIRDADFQLRVRYIFLEAVSMRHQPCLDAFLASADGNPAALFPAFQDDFSGKGWPLKSYFDLLRTVWEVNRTLPEDQRFRVVGVSNPIYWCGIRTARDLELFRRSLASFDYSMYRQILLHLENFAGDCKGIFLTNTRHAYTGIRHRDGEFFWNCGTFFRQWHPGRTCSVRIHNAMLYIERPREPETDTPQTTAGMERMVYRWERMENGRWDAAFRTLGNRPVALPLTGTVFGRAPYVGNHMLTAAPGQTMADAYDALIFLAPLEHLHQTAFVDFIYTPAFKQELQRRYRILYTPAQLQERIRDKGVDSLAELIEAECRPRPAVLSPQSQAVGPADAWRQTPGENQARPKPPCPDRPNSVQ